MTRPIDHSPDWTAQLIADLGYFSTVFVRLLLAYSEEPQSNPKTEDNLLLAVGMLEAASSSLGVKNPFRVPTGPTEARKFFNNSLSDLRDLGDQLTAHYGKRASLLFVFTSLFLTLEKRYLQGEELEAQLKLFRNIGSDLGLSDQDLDLYLERPSEQRENLIARLKALASTLIDANAVREGPVETIDVFISHSSKDAPVAEVLVDLLRGALEISGDKIRCTSVDGYKLKTGVNIDTTLRKEVLEARTFIGIITDVSIDSAYVLFELGARWGAGRHLAPVLAAGAGSAAMKGPLKNINAIACDSRAGVHQIVEDLARELGRRLTNPSRYQKLVDRLIQANAELALRKV
jgi:hypothetical protein